MEVTPRIKEHFMYAGAVVLACEIPAVIEGMAMFTIKNDTYVTSFACRTKTGKFKFHPDDI